MSGLWQRSWLIEMVIKQEFHRGTLLHETGFAHTFRLKVSTSNSVLTHLCLMSLSCCHTTWCCGYLGLINHGTLNGPRLSYWRKCRLHKAKSKQTFNSELIRYTSISFTFLINCNVMLVIRTFLKNKPRTNNRLHTVFLAV